MDFSIKQALAVAVVVGAGLILLSAISLTKGNTGEAKKQTNSMWGSTDESLNTALGSSGTASCKWLPHHGSNSRWKPLCMGSE